MSRLVTLVGYAVIAAVAVALELAARCTHRLATFGEALATVLRTWPGRVAVQAGWLWLGWHIFVRVHWR